VASSAEPPISFSWNRSSTPVPEDKKQGFIVLPIQTDFKLRHWMSTNQLAFDCSGEGENVLGDGDHLRPDAVPWEERDVVAPRGGGAPEGSHLARAQRRAAGSPAGEG
jgi:hypothetical protein